jgi:hypothetical protein
MNDPVQSVDGKAPAPLDVAEVIVRGVFGEGLGAQARYVAKATIAGALLTWKDQLLEEARVKYRHERRKWEEEKARAAELSLKLDLLQKKTGTKA